MVLKNKKKPHKEKVKRKRGKKYVVIPNQNKIIKKSNPFEEVSKKKFIKSNTNQYNELINDYRNKNNVNLFRDNRIGEGSKNLSEDDKMKLRYNVQQRLKKSNKKAKFLFEDEKYTNEEDLIFTHKGKNINDNDKLDIENSDNENEEYYKQLNDYIEKLDEGPKLTKKERLNEIINQSKKLKEDKQKKKEENLNKIEMLDENFSDIVTLLKKRQRTYNKFNDDYDRMTNNFIYLDKTHPTERIKTEEELEIEKQNRLKKLEIQRMKEEEDEEENDKKNLFNKYEYDNDININNKQLTKKERIEKLIQERLERSKLIQDKLKKGNKKIIGEKEENDEDEEEEEEDNLDDLENDEEEEEEEEEEEKEYNKDEENEEEEDEEKEDNLDDLENEEEEEDE